MKRQNVQDSDFTLLFEAVMSGGGAVHLIDHSRNRESNVKVAVDDSAFSYRAQKEFPSIIADLIDLAIAIHTADRLTFQSLRQNQTLIHVVLPARHPEILNQTPLQDKLSNLLEWATGSRWVFEFVKRVDLGRAVEQQPLLSSADPHVDEVALWSGGLDALAGLYTRLKENPEISFMLFGTGSNDGDIRSHLQHMLAQVSTLKGLLKYSENATTQWESLTKRFPELDDIVDRTHEVEDLTPLEMRKCLIRLYQTYVSEWDTVESQISGDFLNQVSDQQVSQDFQLAIE